MDELTFLDLAVLRRIDEDTVVERFGSKINTSFFESANLLGTMKVKGYIEFETSMGGLSKVNLTENGRHTLKHATEKAQEDLDTLDSAILSAIGRGTTDPERLAVELSVKSSDIALRLDKLVYNNYVDYTIRNARVTVSLTEGGFNKVGNVKGEVKLAPPSGQTVPAKPGSPAQSTLPIQKQGDDGSGEDAKEIVSGKSPAPEKKQDEKPKDQSVSRFFSKLAYYIEKYLLFIVLLLVIIIAGTGYIVFTAGA